jgi:hypothetical protein
MVFDPFRVRTRSVIETPHGADCVFVNSYRFPIELISCVFDLVFAEGVEAVFRFAIALMKKNEDAIVALQFEQLLEYLKSGLFEGYKVL